MEQSFETMWRMAKLAGGIDTTVRLIETVIETVPTLKFRNTAGKEIPIRDLAGIARSVQAGTSVPQGASFDQRDLQFLENKFTDIQGDSWRSHMQLVSNRWETDTVADWWILGMHLPSERVSSGDLAPTEDWGDISQNCLHDMRIVGNA